MVAPEDLDLLDPLPGVSDVIDSGRFKGVTYAVMASDAGNDWYNVWVLEQTLACKESTCPGLFRYAYFLYSLVQPSHRYSVSTLTKHWSWTRCRWSRADRLRRCLVASTIMAPPSW